MLELFIMSLTGFQLNPGKIYTVILHLKHRISRIITLSLSDTSWSMYTYGNIAYSIFHTYNMDEDDMARIFLSDSVINMALVMESDTSLILDLGDTFAFSGKSFEIAGFIMIPYPSMRLDSVKIVTNFAWDRRTIKLKGNHTWTRRQIFPIIFLSGQKNNIETFGDGTARILFGKVTILR